MKITLLNGRGAPVLRCDIPDFPVVPEIVYWGAIAYVKVFDEGTYKEAAYLYLNPKPPYV
jgi:hypothetical protein